MFRKLYDFNNKANQLILKISIGMILPIFFIANLTNGKIILETIGFMYILFLLFALINRQYLEYIRKKNIPIIDDEYILIERFTGSQAFPKPYEKGYRFRLKETFRLDPFGKISKNFFVNFVSAKGEKLTVNYVTYIECFELLKINRDKKLKKLKI